MGGGWKREFGARTGGGLQGRKIFIDARGDFVRTQAITMEYDGSHKTHHQTQITAKVQ